MGADNALQGLIDVTPDLVTYLYIDYIDTPGPHSRAGAGLTRSAVGPSAVRRA